MKNFRQITASFLSMLLLLAIFTLNAQAALQAVGPTDPITTIPTFYQDTNSLALMPCLDQNGFCLLPPPFDAATVPTSPIVLAAPISDATFPGEGFYYSADCSLPIETALPGGGDTARLTFVLEYAFLAGVSPNTAIAFLRTDLQKFSQIKHPLTANATYRVTHPYGTFEFTTDGQGASSAPTGTAIRLEDPIGAGIGVFFPPAMQAAPNTNIGPFLTPADGILPTALVGGQLHTYIGDAVTPIPVTGSPTGNNFVRIDRLNAAGGVAATWQTNLFTLMGRVFTDQIPKPLTIDRATYSRDAATGQIDLFVTSLPTAINNLVVSGANIATTTMAEDVPNSGKFFAHIPFAATLPTGVIITNNLDATPVVHPVTLVDEVNVTKVSYDTTSNNLTITAASRDKVAPPVLTVPQFVTQNTLTAGTLVKSLTGTIPPMIVNVNSSKGGTATAIVSVVTPPTAPVAVDDATSTTAGVAVPVNVLVNDTTTGSLDPATVVPVAAAGGTVVADANGTVTFTPAAGFSGAASFTYTVKDTFGQISNAATVSVTVAPVVAPPPPATGATLAVFPASPQGVGTFVIFTAGGVGGSGTYEYEFWRHDGVAWTKVQSFTPVNSWVWYTTAASAGVYTVQVNVRSAGSTASFEGFQAVNYTLTAASAATGVTIVPDKTSPQLTTTPGGVTFTATGQGGTGSYEYEFWLNNGTGWTKVQNMSTNSAWIWNTALATAGNYTLQVNVRSIGSSSSLEAFQSTTFQLQ